MNVNFKPLVFFLIFLMFVGVALGIALVGQPLDTLSRAQATVIVRNNDQANEMTAIAILPTALPARATETAYAMQSQHEQQMRDATKVAVQAQITQTALGIRTQQETANRDNILGYVLPLFVVSAVLIGVAGGMYLWVVSARIRLLNAQAAALREQRRTIEIQTAATLRLNEMADCTRQDGLHEPARPPTSAAVNAPRLPVR